jgi:hypothetical protein
MHSHNPSPAGGHGARGRPTASLQARRGRPDIVGEAVGSLKRSTDPADAFFMDVWFQHLADFFTRDSAEWRAVRKLLNAAAKQSAAVGFAPCDSDEAPRPEHGSVESLEDNSLLILTPRDAGLQFITGEHLVMCIATESGFDIGEVVVLGEWVRRDRNSHRAGVRVSIPRTLEHMQRRERHRLPVAFDLSPRVTLEGGDPPSPVGKGEVLDISESGARLLVDPAREIAVGETLMARMNFPEPFPSFTAAVEVVHLVPTAGDTRLVLGVHFAEPHPELGRAIHKLELKRAQRLRK